MAAVAADQLTKATVVHALRVGEAVDVAAGLSFWHVRNTGHRVRRVRGPALVRRADHGRRGHLDARFFARSGARHPLVPVAIGLLLGGAVSNLWDRAYNGFVTDFIYMRLLPNFNLADTFVVHGRGAPDRHAGARRSRPSASEGLPWDAS